MNNKTKYTLISILILVIGIVSVVCCYIYKAINKKDKEDDIKILDLNEWQDFEPEDIEKEKKLDKELD